MVMAAVLLAVALVALTGVLTWMLLPGKPKSGGRAEVEVQTGIEVESSRLATRSGHIEEQNVHRQTMLVDDGRTVWRIDLENTRGLHRSKCFCGCLLLGRAQPGAEPAGMLYLDEDRAVSKQQCEVIAYRTGLAVRNCSRASVTTVDGCPAVEPVPIRPGSVIGMGRSAWRVVVVRTC